MDICELSHESRDENSTKIRIKIHDIVFLKILCVWPTY